MRKAFFHTTHNHSFCLFFCLFQLFFISENEKKKNSDPDRFHDNTEMNSETSNIEIENDELVPIQKNEPDPIEIELFDWDPKYEIMNSSMYADAMNKLEFKQQFNLLKYALEDGVHERSSLHHETFQFPPAVGEKPLTDYDIFHTLMREPTVRCRFHAYAKENNFISILRVASVKRAYHIDWNMNSE